MPNVRSTARRMPVEIISGYPFKNSGCWSVESKIDRNHHWVNFGVVLEENITNLLKLAT